MNAQPKPSSFAPAERQGVGVLIGLGGATSTGKTLSALRLARGLAADPGDDLEDPDTLARVDARIAFIDTESGRALHYAVAPGEKPTPWKPKVGAKFGFQHAPLHAPFSPERYKELIAEADEAGFRVIIVDSFSHEWDGEGGCHDLHEADLDAFVERARKRAEEKNWRFDEDVEREKGNITAWKRPKMAHKRMVGRLLQCRAHLIVCMRAEDKLRIESKKEQGNNGRTYTKTEITAAKDLPPRERWSPICESRFPYELLTSFVLTPDAPGVPLPLKLQEQHRGMISLDNPLNEQTGVRLAAWAQGASAAEARPRSPANQMKPTRLDDGPPDDEPPPIDDGDDFPGDRPPPEPKGRPIIELWSEDYDPARPERLGRKPGGGFHDHTNFLPREWQVWGAALRALYAASTPAHQAEWTELNAPELLALKTASEKLYAYVREPIAQSGA